MRRLASRVVRRNFTAHQSEESLAVEIEKKYKMLYEQYDKKPSDVVSYRKQLVYRSKNLGMKELDILVGKWALANVDRLDKKELERFEEEVLYIETPDLYKCLTGSDSDFEEFKVPEKHFLRDIKNFSKEPHWNV